MVIQGVSRSKHIVNEGSKAVAVTSTVVSEEVFGAKRVNLALTNVSGGGETITLAFGQEAVAGRGIRLGDGDTYITSADAGYTPSQQRVHAIGSAAATIAIHEELILD